MIGKFIPRRADDNGAKSVQDLVLYIMKESSTQADDVLEGVWTRNILGDTSAEIIFEMKDVIWGRPDIRNPIEHYLLSWPKEDMPTMEQVVQCGDYVLERLGAEEHQAVFTLHRDTDNMHIHFAINRVNGDMEVARFGDGWQAYAIQRIARELEIKHKWSHTPGGRYEVVGGEIVDTRKKASLGMKAKDFEAYTGKASEERKLQQVCSAIFDSSKAWPEIHAKLAACGITLQPKGSGGILVVNGVSVKLSRIGNKYGWGKMVARLGAFVAGEPLPAQEPAPAAADGLPMDPGRPLPGPAFPPHPDVPPEVAGLMRPDRPVLETPSWAVYEKERAAEKEARKVYREERTASRAQMKAGHDAEYAAHKARCNEEMQGFYNRGLDGNSLNKLMKSAAARHRLQLGQLRKSIKADLVAWEASWPATSGPKFPSFKDWLGRDRMTNDRAMWVNRRKLGLLLPPGAVREEAAELAVAEIWLDIPVRMLYQKAQSDSSGNIYYEKVTAGGGYLDGETAFVDMGGTIKIFSEEPEVLLAAMQLAMAKWGGVWLAGDEEFKGRCYELALGQGINVRNPEFELLRAMGRTARPMSEGDRRYMFRPVTESDMPKVKGVRPSAVETTGLAYLAHVAEIRTNFSEADPFQIDFMAAVRLRGTGHTQEAIRDALMLWSKAAWQTTGNSRRTDFEIYVCNTVESAFGSEGDIWLEQWYHLVGKWEEIEAAAISKAKGEAPHVRAAIGGPTRPVKTLDGIVIQIPCARPEADRLEDAPDPPEDEGPSGPKP